MADPITAEVQALADRKPTWAVSTLLEQLQQAGRQRHAAEEALKQNVGDTGQEGEWSVPHGRATSAVWPVGPPKTVSLGFS